MCPCIIVAMTYTLYGLNTPSATFLLFCSVFALFLWWSIILSKIWIFFDLQADLSFVSLKNNLRIILGSKSKIFKNVELSKKLDINTKSVYLYFYLNENPSPYKQ